MVESKMSVYDTDSPPLVPATPTSEVQEGDLLRSDVREINRESPSASPPLLQHGVTPHSSSRGHDSTEADVLIEDVPMMPTEEEDHERKRKVGAGVLSGVVGLFVGGPILAMILGFGAAYAAEKEGALGDSARAVGEVAITVRDKATEVNNKHHVVAKSKVAAAEAFENAKAMDQKHNLLERTGKFLVCSWNSLVDFVQRHHVVERSATAAGRGATWAADKISNYDQASAAPQATATISNPASK